MAQQIYCAQCGTANNPGAAFCTNCGTRLVGPVTAPPPPGQGTMPPATAPVPPAVTSGASPAPAPMMSAGIDKEPMLLLDVTGSMNYATSATDATPRRETIREAISLIVGVLAEEDSQAAHEEGGGLRTVTFAGGQARDIGDLNPANLQQTWGQISWAGGTRIMPGWTTLLRTYQEEFGGVAAAQQPQLLALVITDGEADDTAQFAQALTQTAGGVYVVLAIIGYGPDHDAALRAYQAIEQASAHVRVLTFASETDPNVIARALLKMIE